MRAVVETSRRWLVYSYGVPVGRGHFTCRGDSASRMSWRMPWNLHRAFHQKPNKAKGKIGSVTRGLVPACTRYPPLSGTQSQPKSGCGVELPNEKIWREEAQLGVSQANGPQAHSGFNHTNLRFPGGVTWPPNLNNFGRKNMPHDGRGDGWSQCTFPSTRIPVFFHNSQHTPT